MSTTPLIESAKLEHPFWLQVLGDHSRFIKGALDIDQKEHSNRAQLFVDQFDELLKRSRAIISIADLNQLTKESYRWTIALRDFKLAILRKQLEGELQTGLSHVFYNHMVNELEEYLRILSHFLKGEVPPPLHPVHHHLLWLLDASGHVGAIIQSTDRVEHDILEKSKKFEQTFKDYYLKAIEVAGFLRTQLNDFPALQRFNKQVSLEMIIFREFLQELEEMEIHASSLGTFNALMADHMAREGCYYLMKLAQTTRIPMPNCDPAKPRVKP